MDWFDPNSKRLLEEREETNSDEESEFENNQSDGEHTGSNNDVVVDDDSDDSDDSGNHEETRREDEASAGANNSKINYKYHRLVLDADWTDFDKSTNAAQRERVLLMMQPFLHLFPELQAELEKISTKLEDMVDVEYVDPKAPPRCAVNEDIKEKLETAKSQLGLLSFRNLQERVCVEGIHSPEKDIIVNAPCGFGKVRVSSS